MALQYGGDVRMRSGLVSSAKTSARRTSAVITRGADLISLEKASFIGEADQGYSGESVAYAGDVNDDGLHDFLIAAPFNDLAAGNAGQTYLFLGEPANAIPGELAIPNEFVLYQNYTSPINPENLIEYAIPNASDITLLIYNLLCQEVRRWQFSGHTAGYHSLRCARSDGSGNRVPSGIYLYRLQGKFTPVYRGAAPTSQRRRKCSSSGRDSHVGATHELSCPYSNVVILSVTRSPSPQSSCNAKGTRPAPAYLT